MTKILAALLLLTTVPAIAQVSPPVAAEREARSCYDAAQRQWNTVMASASYDVARLTGAYHAFANCATIAVQTGPVENGHRIPWTAEYFADTVGAFYAQEQLIGADAGGKCAHIALAADLAEQAIEVAPVEAMPAVDGLESARDDLNAHRCK